MGWPVITEKPSLLLAQQMGTSDIPTGDRFLSRIKVPGACWPRGGALTTFLPLSPNSVLQNSHQMPWLLAIHIPEGQRFPLTYFICTAQVLFHLHQQFNGYSCYFLACQLWLPHVAEPGTCMQGGPAWLWGMGHATSTICGHRAREQLEAPCCPSLPTLALFCTVRGFKQPCEGPNLDVQALSIPSKNSQPVVAIL